MSDSIAFDRAAEYYDDTRGLSEEGVRHTTEALAEVFRGAGPILEVGVGTGQVALPLHDAGVHVVGVDLSRPMLSKLLAKAGGGPPFPLVEGDATSLPFADEAFAGAYLRWVLHLIPDWRAAVREIARILAPGSAFVAALGAYGGYRQEMQARFAEITGISTEPAGLAWNGWDQLDAEVASAGAAEAPRHRVHRSGPGRPRALHAGDRGQPILMDVGGAGRSDPRGRGRRGPTLGRGPLGAAERDPTRDLRVAVRRLPAALTAYSST